MIVAIDFDGTIAEHRSGGEIGPELPGAIETLRDLKRRHTLILWTCRGNQRLIDASIWLHERGIEMDAYNENIHALTGASDEEEYYPRKVFAHVYIDDRIIGGFPGWDVIRKRLLHPNIAGIAYDS